MCIWIVLILIASLQFREFYIGSDQDLTDSERATLEELFSTKLYVQKEIEYSYISTKGSVSQSRMKFTRLELKMYE